MQSGTIADPSDLNPDDASHDLGTRRAGGDLSAAAARALLDRLARRDERAMRELHDRYGRRIFLFAVARLRDDTAAETVMIDTLFEVWKHPDRFRGESRLSTWILGIAKYKILNTFRSAGPEHEDVDDHADTISDPDADVGQGYEEKERQRILMDCIEGLSGPQRECMQLVFLEGMALAEVADVQRVPEGTVKTRLFHGRKNLRDCVQRKYGGAA